MMLKKAIIKLLLKSNAGVGTENSLLKNNKYSYD